MESHGTPIFYTLYWAQGEHSKIPDSGVASRDIAECPSSGEFGFNSTSMTGKYTYWVVGAEQDYRKTNLTDPSNLLVLDFGE